MPTACYRSPSARGYTLVEMIVVMAIVTSLVALSLPALRNPLSKSELRGAAKEIRHALIGARLTAIESAVPQLFRFVPGTGRFETVPKETFAAGAGLSFGSAGGSVVEGLVDADSTAADGPQDEAITGNLPAEVTFYRQQVAVEVSDDLVDSTDTTSQQWASPIIFYPNGRTSNARIQLQGARDYRITLTLRGVTGSVTIGEPTRVVAPVGAEIEGVIGAEIEAEIEAEVGAEEEQQP